MTHPVSTSRAAGGKRPSVSPFVTSGRSGPGAETRKLPATRWFFWCQRSPGSDQLRERGRPLRPGLFYRYLALPTLHHRRQGPDRYQGPYPGTYSGNTNRMAFAGEDASFISFDGLRVSARLYLPAPALGFRGQNARWFIMSTAGRRARNGLISPGFPCR